MAENREDTPDVPDAPALDAGDESPDEHVGEPVEPDHGLDPSTFAEEGDD